MKINLNLSKKRILITIAVVIILAIWIVGFIIGKNKIAYIPVDKSFLISILDNPFEDVKKEAEKAFLQKLGITQEDACLMNVNIATNIRINPSYAGKNYKLSFCE